MFAMRLAWMMAAAALVGSGAQAAGYHAPRTSFGAPDLQGIWTNSSITRLQRPAIFKSLIATDAEAAVMEQAMMKLAAPILSTAPIDPNAPAPPVVKQAPQTEDIEMDLHLARIDGQMRSSWITDPPDGQLPFTEAGRRATRAAARETLDGPEGRPTSERCLTAVGSPEGPPMMNTGYNPNYRIVQSKDYVAVEVEMNHDIRMIRLGDRAHLPAAVTPWMGDSVGWWEGDTLVVETTNLNPKGAYIGVLGGGFAYSAGARITERFTRTAKDRILYEFSVDDPVTFTRVWRAQMPWRTARGPIYEYACHEGNYSLANVLSGAREQEKAARGGR
jgi:hypothetical protein